MIKELKLVEMNKDWQVMPIEEEKAFLVHRKYDKPGIFFVEETEKGVDVAYSKDAKPFEMLEALSACIRLDAEHALAGTNNIEEEMLKFLQNSV